MKLSIVCVTQGHTATWPLIKRLLMQAGELNAEVVFGAHGAEAQRLLAGGPSEHRVVPVEGRFLEELVDPALEAASGDYILRVDDDELLPEEFIAWLKTDEYLQHDSWFFPRFHPWPDGDHIISSHPCYPDFQGRLTTREKASRPPRLHSGSPWPAYRAPVWFEHFQFLVRTKEERRAQTARYATLMGQPHTTEQVDVVFPEDIAGVTVVPRSEIPRLLAASREIVWWREAGQVIPAVLEREFEDWGIKRGKRAIRPRSIV